MQDNDLSYQIIGCAMRVHREMGPGLREKPYENALAIDFEEQVISFTQQPQYPIFDHGRIVGQCQPDLVVENEIVIDCKSITKIGDNELGQMMNYLKIVKLNVGLVINFGGLSLEFKRVTI